MTCDEVLRDLQAAGTEQNRKIFRRHGVGDNQFGVSYGHLGALAKRIKSDDVLARHLWATGNHDARVLATMIADPKRIEASRLESWAKGLTNSPMAEALAKLASRTPHAAVLMGRWIGSGDEWIGSAGWMLLAMLADPRGKGGLTDGELTAHLETIERDLHASPNRVRYSMNAAIIAIGARGGAMEERALAAASRVGAVEVDHGETGCRTPDAADAIRKARAHLEAKEARRQAKAP